MVRNIRIIAIIVSMFVGTFSYAQLTEPGGGDGSAPTDGGIAGGGAPIGSGLALIVGMSLAYASTKTFLMGTDDEPLK